MIAFARRTDPETSHAAAALVDELNNKQWAVLQVLGQRGPLTDEELVEEYETWMPRLGLAPQSPSGIRTRRNELWNRRLVQPCGEARTSAGRRCMVWEVTP